MIVTFKRHTKKPMTYFNTWCLVTLFLLFSNVIAAQMGSRELNLEDEQVTIERQDSINKQNAKAEIKKDKNAKPPIQDYKIISIANDTTFVDTTLTIKKEYKFNYLRKDYFGLMPFSNVGQTYNTLSYNFENIDIMPLFGARAKHFNFMEVNDINYYYVPTPWTDLLFKTGFEQGQYLDAFFTVNMTPQFNFSIAYKGLRSLGKYQHILASSGNFRTTANYSTKNNRYNAKAHIVVQDIMNQENGGLDEESVLEFESGDPDFLDRSILEVEFEDAESVLEGKRFYLNHHYKIIDENKTSFSNQLTVNHVLNYNQKYYQYEQSTADTDYFGSSFAATNLSDKTTLETVYNQLQLNYNNNILGDFQINASDTYYNYGYNQVVIINGQTITNRLKGNIIEVGGKYHKLYNGFNILAEAGANVSGDFEGNFFTGEASYKITKDIELVATLNHSSKVPNYNTLLYQSNYIDYNWQNNFSNVETQQLAFQFKSNKIVTISADFSTINDYVYFAKDPLTEQVMPFQNNELISYLRVRLDKEFKLGKFALDNTVEYQNVKDDNHVLNVPEFNTRNTLYYSTHVFNKALFLQTGVTFNYFTNYYMDGYNPLLAEFFVQTDNEYGNYPRFDYFLNAKLRQTRIYLKAEHFNAAFTGYNYFSAPYNPYRDFAIRFGLVWDFFL